MKILLFTTHLNIGGIGCYTLSLAKALKNKGHSVLIASSGGDLVGELTEDIAHIKINIGTKSELSPKVLLAISKIISIVKKEGIEIIHSQTRVTQVVSEAVSKICRIPYVTTCHGFFRPRWVRRTFGCWGDKAIAISEAVREHLVNDLKVKKDKAVLIHNGIDIGKFSFSYSDNEKKSYRRLIGLKDGPVIGIIARLSVVKGHKYLLDAMHRVVNAKPDARLLIVGSGSLKSELADQVKRLNLGNNVVFLNSTLDTAKPLSVIDIFVLPSLKEGLGLSIMEAQAAGIAVVASNVGGIYTVVKDNQSGLLIPPRDSESLSNALLKLIANPDLIKKMGETGQKNIKEKFSLDSMTDKIEEVYKECIKKD